MLGSAEYQHTDTSCISMFLTCTAVKCTVLLLYCSCRPCCGCVLNESSLTGFLRSSMPVGALWIPPSPATAPTCCVRVKSATCMYRYAHNQQQYPGFLHKSVSCEIRIFTHLVICWLCSVRYSIRYKMKGPIHSDPKLGGATVP